MAFARRVALLATLTGSLTATLLTGGTNALAKSGPRPDFATLSSNWAGYAVSARARSRLSFKSVSAHWVQPPVSCTGSPGYSGFWVGLGGFHSSSRALEQAGTEADCGASGQANYYAWYELVPQGPVRVRLDVHPGDAIAASVTVIGRRVRLALRDLKTGAAWAATESAASVDVSSAEWIAEAPSACLGAGGCRVLPLANFGSVAFSDASATSSDGSVGSIGASRWTPTVLELLDFGGRFGRAQFGSAAAIATATPTSLTAGGSGFTVAWRPAPAPTLPSTPPPVGPLPGE